MTRVRAHHPRAIAMWDFSWIERRWPGAGYEDWNEALDELVERGYDAVRVDAFPHFISAAPDKSWLSLTCGQDGDWGSPTEIAISVKDTLIEFIGKCRDRGVAVALSTWYKDDPEHVRMNIRTPADLAQIWADTLGHIDRAGLIDSVLYVDFCNEFPQRKWAPYLYRSDEDKDFRLASQPIKDWMRQSIAAAKVVYPDLDYTFSMCTQFESWRDQDVSMLDFLEPHIWMSHPEVSDFYNRIGYSGPKRDFQQLVRGAEREYRAGPKRWHRVLSDEIAMIADWSRASGRPLITTECWAIIHYRDWPMLNWNWVKELCEAGVTSAIATGRWTAMGTSNFCGPQYRGMWRDIAWHRRLTDSIKKAPIDADLRG
jgi:Sugar-binding cellulase-like